MTLRPITQAESDAWDAQPGTDAFGRPWSSWDRLIVTEHQADLIAVQAAMLAARPLRPKRRQVHQESPALTPQLELAL